MYMRKATFYLAEGDAARHVSTVFMDILESGN